MKSVPCSMQMLPRRSRRSVADRGLLVLILLSLAACDLIVDRGQSKEALVQVEIESTRLMHWAARARSAVPGDNEALARLAAADDAIAQAIAILDGERDDLAENWKRPNHNWRETHLQVQTALKASSRFERDGELHDRILATIPQLQASLMRLAVQEAEAVAPNAKTLFSLMQLALVLERVQNRLPRALAGVDDAISAVDSISRDVAYFGKTLHSLRHGEAVPERAAQAKATSRPELDAIIELGKPLFSAADELMENSITRFEGMDALAMIESEAEELAERAARARRFKH